MIAIQEVIVHLSSNSSTQNALETMDREHRLELVNVLDSILAHTNEARAEVCQLAEWILTGNRRFGGALTEG